MKKLKNAKYFLVSNRGVHSRNCLHGFYKGILHKIKRIILFLMLLLIIFVSVWPGFFLKFIYQSTIPIKRQKQDYFFHSVYTSALKACHGWGFGISPRNEAIFSRFGRICPQPPVHSLVIKVSIDPITSFYSQIIWGLGLKLVIKKLWRIIKFFILIFYNS